MLANNLANVATAGYKSDREFYSLYVAPEALESSLDGPLPSTLPVIERRWTDFNQGTLTPTASPLDFALSGQGFFVVNGPVGPLYTRNGAFRLSSAGLLTTEEGYPVRSAAGGQIQSQSATSLEVAPDGTVRQSGLMLGQLAVVSFDQPASLEKVGHNYFRAGTSDGAKPAAAVEIHQGKLEASNVATPESAVRLINIMRQFEMLQRAIVLGAEMNRRALEEVARVNP
jgi:flagellar basal body rod protein FlgG